MNTIRSSIVVLILLAIITGVAYPLLVTGLANVLFPWQAQGSLIQQEERVIGSTLIGQNYQSDRYFFGRPSATADYPYNALASSGSNLAISNPLLNEDFAQRSQQLRMQNPDAGQAIPVDLLTASASGLDPANFCCGSTLSSTAYRKEQTDPTKSSRIIDSGTNRKATPCLYGGTRCERVATERGIG